MRTMKTTVTHLIFLVLLIALCVTPMSPAFAESGIEVSSSIDNEDFNLILLIDRSGSMKNTDRSNLVKDAAKLIVDLCDEGGYSRIAVMSFDTSVHNSGFITVSDEAQREIVKNEISAIDYEDGGTDIGLALLTAVEYIRSEGNPSQKNMILLFTDGYTQDLIGKKEEESEEQLAQALELARDYSCSIFTIGTDYNGSMKQNGRDALEGIRNYQIANGLGNTPEELLTIINAKDQDGMKAVVAEFEKIYATIEKRIIHEGNVIIESPNIAEVNIIVSAPGGVSEVRVTAPSGNSALIDLEGRETVLDEAKIVFKEGQAYQLIKIVEPIAEGTWLLNVADGQSEPILNYTWMLTTKAEITMTLEQSSKDSVSVTVRPKNIEAGSIRDFYNSLVEQGIVITREGDQENSSTLELEYDATGPCLRASFPVESSSNYTVTARVSDGYFIRTCKGTIEIPDIWTHPSGEESDFGTIYVWNWFSRSVDLAERVEVSLQSCESVSGGEELAGLEVSGTTLKASSMNAGTGELKVVSRMTDGSRIVLTGKLKVLNPIYVLVALLFVVAVVALIRFLKRQKRSLRGNYFIRFNISLADEGQYTVPEVYVPVQRVFCLYDLVMSYRRDSLKPDWAQILDDKVLSKKSPYFKALKDNKFYVCSDEKSFKNRDTIYRQKMTNYEWHSDDEQLKVTFNY